MVTIGGGFGASEFVCRVVGLGFITLTEKGFSRPFRAEHIHIYIYIWCRVPLLHRKMFRAYQP